MAKVITQETFNDVVKENVEEFEMSENEAIIDAIKQFEAQGVNLSNIIKNPQKALAIVNTVERLKDLVINKELEENKLIPVLIELANAVTGEISYKLLAAKKGVYSVLIDCLKRATGSLKQHTLNAMITLMDGYPDLLDTDGINILLGLLQESSPVEILELSLKWLVVAVTKHEPTRSVLIRNQVAQKLHALFELHKDKEDVIAAVCAATQVLILDDDVRVVHGNAHEHARCLANELLPLLTSALSNFTTNIEVTNKILGTLTCLLVRNEFCIIFHENNGLKYVMDVMVEHPDEEKIARECFLILKGLAGSDEVKEPILAAGAAPLLVALLERHYKNSKVAVAACMCLAALSLRSPNNTKLLAAAGASETLVRCLQHWKENRSIMTHGCSAIRNQVSRCPDLREEYKNLQVDELLLEAKSIHGDLGFEAKSVLLDLGCEVKLKEEWRGTGVQMTN